MTPDTESDAPFTRTTLAAGGPHPVPADSPPGWESAADLACPLCGYNLRGLTDPRCPECGYRFAWRDLTDPAKITHPYLFEHHPERGWRSFWQTAWGGLRPARFWSTLYPTQRSRAGRLVAYWLLTFAFSLLALATNFGLAWWDFRFGQWAGFVPSRWGYVGPSTAPATSFLATFQDIWAAYGSELGVTLEFTLALLAWPWLTLAALMIFQFSMRRARVNTTHVLRAALYSADFGLWLGLLYLIVGVALIAAHKPEILLGHRSTYGLFAVGGVVLFLLGTFCHSPFALRLGFVYLIVALLLGSGNTPGMLREAAGSYTLFIAANLIVLYVYRLSTAYRKYLRFDHPIATVVCTQIIVALATVAALEYFFGGGIMYTLVWWFMRR